MWIKHTLSFGFRRRTFLTSINSSRKWLKESSSKLLISLMVETLKALLTATSLTTLCGSRWKLLNSEYLS